MRMMMMVQMEVEAANAAIEDGKLGALVERTMRQLEPEAAYFTAVDGLRTGFIIFDLEEPAQIPEVAEPWFQLLNVKIDLKPVMNAEEVGKGIQAWQSSR